MGWKVFWMRSAPEPWAFTRQIEVPGASAADGSTTSTVPGNPEPSLFGLPRTLWLGLLAYIALVIVTFIGTRVHPDEADQQETEGGE